MRRNSRFRSRKAGAAFSRYPVLMSDHAFTFTGRFRSFKYAFRGFGLMLRSQHNAWIHAVATVIACGAAAAVGLGRLEWCVLIAAIVAVWVAEALNTAFEFLCDVASPEFHPMVEKAKDVAAGGVLLAAIGSTILGSIIFLSHLVPSAAR